MGSAITKRYATMTWLGEYRQAIDLHTQALAIARDSGNRYIEASALDYLGPAWLATGDARQAVTLFEQAVNMADTTGDIEPATETRLGLARAQLQLGDPAAALAAITAAREMVYPPGEPTRRLLEGVAQLELHHAGESMRTFSDALTAAGALLALADRNVAALQARALALNGLAAATGDPARASEAVQAFTRAQSVHHQRRGRGRRHSPPARGDRRRRRDVCPRRGPCRAGPVTGYGHWRTGLGPRSRPKSEGLPPPGPDQPIGGG